MSKPFFEVFPALQLNADIRDLMGQTEVERVSATKRRDFLRVYLKSTRLIQKADIWTTEQEIKKQLFPQANLTVKIYEKFELSSQYNPEKLMDIYKDSILEEFREYSHIQYNALKTAKIEYPSGNEMLLTMEDTVLNRSMEGEILQILEKILDYMKKCKVSAYDEEKHTGLVRHVLLRYGFTSHEIMVCLVINGTKLPHAQVLIDSLREIPGMTSITFSINKEKTNVIMGNEIRLLWGKTYITDSIGDVQYQISPLSFYQVNPVQTERLYGQALEYAGLTGQETVWDLYCGIGTISLFLAQKAKQVYGVEIVPQASEDAKNNAKINRIENAEFYVGKAEEVLPEYYDRYQREHNGETAHADVIVVDPPRKGCEESLLQTMVDMQPEKIVYVSCDSATLARDVKYLRANGYELRKVRAVDQFPHTVHTEACVLLTKETVL